MELLTAQERLDYLRRLTRLTEESRVEWQQNGEPLSEYGFYALLPSTSVWIDSLDDDDFHPYRFTIDKLNISDLHNPDNELVVIESSPEDMELNEALGALYSAVKNRVLRLEDVRLQLFSDLDILEGL